MTKKQERELIWLKYEKHCAYCGKELQLKEMQVDHVEPKRYNGKDTIENKNPSCRRCNHYKRASDLRQFRMTMETLHKRIEEKYINKVAIDYGIIIMKPFSGRFYFERFEEQNKFINNPSAPWNYRK